jgi:hypothetical protein
MNHSACRVGDTGTGVCNLHGSAQAFTTTFYEGSSVASADGLGIVLVGHRGHASCGHDTIASTGAPFTDVLGVKIHRVGDSGYIIGDVSSTYIANAGSTSTDSL